MEDETRIKMAYTAPELVIFGSVEEITQQVACGDTLDATFDPELHLAVSRVCHRRNG
jgi:hypothetical protein